MSYETKIVAALLCLLLVAGGLAYMVTHAG
jgi:hypothetical protein